MNSYKYRYDSSQKSSDEEKSSINSDNEHVFITSKFKPYINDEFDGTADEIYNNLSINIPSIELLANIYNISIVQAKKCNLIY